MNIVYIIGAGASQAIDPEKKRIPGMEMQDHFKIFKDDYEALKSGAENMYGIINLMHEIKNNPNIENSLQKLEEAVSFLGGSEAKTKQVEEKFIAIRTLIARLFSRLHTDVVSKIELSPYDALAKALSEEIPKQRHSHYFISFNYDVWLERSFQKFGVWNPVNGYLKNANFPQQFIGPDSRIRNLPTADRPLIRVFKPHGCLSWLVPEKEHYKPPIFNLDNAELTSDGKFAKGVPTYIPSTDSKININGIGYIPLIVPPLQNKGFAGEFLWKVHEQAWGVVGDLNANDAVVIIGWSMPATDFFTRQRIFESRTSGQEFKRVKDLIVCDINQGSLFYNRFQATIPTSHPAPPWTKGFRKDFVDEVLVRLWDGKL